MMKNKTLITTLAAILTLSAHARPFENLRDLNQDSKIYQSLTPDQQETLALRQERFQERASSSRASSLKKWRLLRRVKRRLGIRKDPLAQFVKENITPEQKERLKGLRENLLILKEGSDITDAHIQEVRECLKEVLKSADRPSEESKQQVKLALQSALEDEELAPSEMLQIRNSLRSMADSAGVPQELSANLREAILNLIEASNVTVEEAQIVIEDIVVIMKDVMENRLK